jgi:hypothetical protein
MVRLLVAAALVLSALAISDVRAAADPATCPPACDRIPLTAWPAAADLPLADVYHWPGLAGIAVTAPSPRFRFEELCGSPPVAKDPRGYAVAAKAVVDGGPGQWQLQVQVMHWRGETWRGGALVDQVMQTARSALRACQSGAPQSSPSITTDASDQLAAVVSGPVVMHQYVLAHPQSSSISEVSMWLPSGLVLPPPPPWPVISDSVLFDAMAAPLCAAYLGSCG